MRSGVCFRAQSTPMIPHDIWVVVMNQAARAGDDEAADVRHGAGEGTDAADQRGVAIWLAVRFSPGGPVRFVHCLYVAQPAVRPQPQQPRGIEEEVSPEFSQFQKGV